MIRSDLSVEWDVSPRIITIAAPSTEITIQDLHDTCRDLEFNKMSEPILIDSAGKEDLGGDVAVGLTATLQDAQVAFEARPGPDWVLVKISGGNLVALNDAGDNIDPRKATAFVSADRASSSSATTQGISDIVHMSFGEVITFDMVNGYSLATIPADVSRLGNKQFPVNNTAEAYDVAIANGFNSGHVYGNMELSADDNISNFTLTGQGPLLSLFTLADAATVDNTTLKNAAVQGYLDGTCVLEKCLVRQLFYVAGSFDNCKFTNEGVTLADNSIFMASECGSKTSSYVPIYSSGINVQMFLSGIRGEWKLFNLTAGDHVEVDLDPGLITLDSATCTGGTINARGVGFITDENGNHIPSGTWNGVTIENETVCKHSVADGVWEHADGTRVADSLLGKAVVAADNLHATIYERDDDTTISHEFDISFDKRTRTPV